MTRAARRPDRPSRRELALALPLLPLLGWRGPRPGLALAQESVAGKGYAIAILLRHAEKDASGDQSATASGNPAISEVGRARARALARLLDRAGVTHLFASQFRRTSQTLAPLAQAQGLKIEVVPAAETSGLADRIRVLPAGSVSVVAGHSNTIPALALALGGTLEDLEAAPEAASASSRAGPAMLRDSEYSRIFVLTLRVPGAGEPDSDPRASVLELAYGA